MADTEEISQEIEKEEKSSYRSIFKATSLFGGVQVYQILINIIKQKFIAILLGPAGVGINGLYTSATQMIQDLTGMGLQSSSVRNVSEAYGTGNQDKVNRVVTTLRKLVWVTGLLGMIVVIALSPVLSRTSLGDSNHILAFIIISITLLFAQISAGQRVILQGTRKLKYLAKATAYGVTIGLFVSVPLYYFFGTKGIVPNIVIASLTTLLLTWYFARKVDVQTVPMTTKEVIGEGKTMLTMGIAMSLTNVLTSVIAYALRGFIRSQGGVEDVGLFNAGYQLMNQYIGFVFTAMITDFYPRLAAVKADNAKCCDMLNKQAEIGLLILAPMLCVSIIFIPIVVRILFSEAFLVINDYIVWVSIGIFFKIASFAIGYILLAKAELKLFMITETISSLVTFAFNIVGYKLMGLTGLGIASAAGFLFYLIMIYIIARRRYEFSYSGSFIKLFSMQFLFTVVCMICYFTLPTMWKYIVGSMIIIISLYISLKGLNSRMDLSSILKSKLHR